jgi:proteasome lid subunit RPN8/RPN11
VFASLAPSIIAARGDGINSCQKNGCTAAGESKSTNSQPAMGPAGKKTMSDLFQRALLDVPRNRRTPSLLFNPKEFKIQALRECLTPAEMQLCDTPDKAAAYWCEHIPSHPYFNRDVECFVVLLLNTRRKIQGHCLISTGTLDTILVHPREVFRTAVIGAAAAIVLMHNHPSGDPTPSEADIKVTRDLIRGGQLLKIDVLDHIVMGQPGGEDQKGFRSLRELGYFYS